MKRLTTYYFLLLGCLSVFFALYLPLVATSFEDFVSRFGSGIKWGYPFPWWPWVGVVVCAVGTVLSLWGIPKDNVLRHLLVITLFVELGAMSLTVAAFIVLWFRL